LPHVYLVHHEPESVIITVMIITVGVTIMGRTICSRQATHGSNVIASKSHTARQALYGVMEQKGHAKFHVSGPIAQLHPQLLLQR